MSTFPSLSIAIAGAGLLGRLLGWQLLKRGHRITLYEASAFNAPKAAAFTAAGMVSPLSEAVVSEYAVYQMGMFAMQQWPSWLQEFETAEHQSRYFRHQGSLVIAHPQDLPELRQFERELQQILPNEGGYRRVGSAEIQTLEPDLQPGFEQGLLLEDEAHLDNRGLMAKLLQEISTLGGTLIDNTAVDVFAHRVHVGESDAHYDLVIDCRGIGAKQYLPTLRGVRGETLHVHTKEIVLQRPVRLMHPRYQLYIVPKPEHRFIIGATQIESEDLSPMSLQSSLELSSALYTLAPAFSEARILEMDVNLRPGLMDNMPRVIEQPGLIIANGLFRHGYLLAPAVVSNVIDRIEQKTTPIFNDILSRSYP